MALRIRVAHDFICPWCWVGLLQAKRLIAEEGCEIEWVGFELFPVEVPWPAPRAAPPPPPNKPPIPSRFELLLAAEAMEMPIAPRPRGMRTSRAHQAVEFAKRSGEAFDFVEALYRAYWEEGRAIDEEEELARIGAAHGLEVGAMLEAVRATAFRDAVVGFDQPAYAVGVYNVPTFYIGEGRYAEQPYRTLLKAVREVAVRA